MNRDLVNAKAKERKDSTPTFQFNKVYKYKPNKYYLELFSKYLA